jgi:propanediol dehydratase small subunit
LRKYFKRNCQGREWKKEFPTAGKEDIRNFLEALIEGFGLPRKLRLRFSPQDRPIEIYDIIAPHVDSFEFEEFSMSLEKNFGKGLSEKMDDSWTLGDIFRHVTKRAEPVAGGDAAR